MKNSVFSVLSLVAIITIFANNFQIVQSDISDDECGIEPEIFFAEPSTDKPVNISASYVDEILKKRGSRKSLLIVFDGTNSMRVALDQMREAAKDIISNLYQREDRPIKNYVLSVFKDPCKRYLDV